MSINNVSSLINSNNLNSFFSSSNDKVDGSTKVDSFSNMLTNKLDALSQQDNNYNQMKTDYIQGNRDDIQNILIEGEKTSLNLSFALQVRNKLVDMFQEISRMQI